MLFFSLLFLLSFLCIFVSSSEDNSTLTEGLRELIMQPREQTGGMTICGLPLSQTPPFQGPAQSAFYFAPPAVFGPSLLAEAREFI